MKKRSSYIVQALLISGIIIAVNLLSGTRFARLDLTSDKRYTLSDVSKNIADSLDAILTVNIYLEGDFQPRIKRFSDAVRTTLIELKAYGGSNIQYQFHNPTDNPDLQKMLVEKGVRPEVLLHDL